MERFIQYEWKNARPAPSVFEITQDGNQCGEYFRVFYVNQKNAIRETVMDDWPIKEWLPRMTSEKPDRKKHELATPTSVTAFTTEIGGDFSGLVVLICDLPYRVVQRGQFVWYLVKVKTEPKKEKL